MTIIRVILMVCFCLLVTEMIDAQTEIPEYREIFRIDRGVVPLLSIWSEKFAFNPDGTQIAASASQTAMSIWDVSTGEIIRTFDFPAAKVYWSPDGNYLAATNTLTNSIQVWSAETTASLYEIDDGFHIAWSPDSTRFATTSAIYDSATGNKLFELRGDWMGGEDVFWSPDGSKIATTSAWDWDYLHVWSSTGQYLDTYWGGITASWSPDGTLLATESQIRDVTTGLPVTIIEPMTGDIVWHPDGQWVASTRNLQSENKDTIYLWDANSGELVTSWVLEGCEIHGFTWSADGERFAANCIRTEPEYDNDLLIWERVQ